MKKIRKLIGNAIKIVLFLALVVIAISLLTPNENVAPRFRVEKASKGSIIDVVNASGTLNPIKVVDVGTQVSGKVNKVYVTVNEEVKEGELLAEIDPAILVATLKQSKSSFALSKDVLDQAERDYKRDKALLAQDFIAKVDVEHAEQAYHTALSQYDVAKTQVERDTVNLDYTKIISPVDGVVISQEANEGQTLSAGLQTPNLFKIAGDMTKMKIDVNLPESDIGKVKKDMKVTFTVDAYPDREFKGFVQKINLNPNTQQGVVTYTINVMVDNAERLLLPGMTAFVSIKVSEVPNVLRIPAVAVRFTPPVEKVSPLKRIFQPNARNTGGREKPFMLMQPVATDKQTVYVLKDGAPVPVDITTGASDDINIEVKSGGLHEGDDVIVGLVKANLQ